jgi:hypothetical protein
VSAPNVVPFVVTNRTGKRNRAGCVLVTRLCIAAYHVASYFGRRQRLLLGLDCWFVGMASEPLLPCGAIERRWPALWAHWLPNV